MGRVAANETSLAWLQCNIQSSFSMPCSNIQQGAASELSDPSSAALEGFESGRRGRQREASSEQTRGTSQQGSHPNR